MEQEDPAEPEVICRRMQEEKTSRIPRICRRQRTDLRVRIPLVQETSRAEQEEPKHRRLSDRAAVNPHRTAREAWARRRQEKRLLIS